MKTGPRRGANQEGAGGGRSSQLDSILRLGEFPLGREEVRLVFRTPFMGIEKTSLDTIYPDVHGPLAAVWEPVIFKVAEPIIEATLFKRLDGD